MKNKSKSISIINFAIFIVLFCTYIFPTGLIDSSLPFEKLIFTICICGMLVIFKNRFSLKELIFILFIIIMTILSKSINYLLFLPIVFLTDVIKCEKQIKNYLKKSKILYICLMFTLLYSAIFFGDSGRYAHSAIKEINQSGLAIFCLAIMLMYKNKKVGILTLIFGMLTFSRSYYLGLILYIISKTKLGKKISKKRFFIKKSTYFNITLISTIILFFMGIYFINQYKVGNIFWGDEISTRLVNFLDYSNLFRFVANVALLTIFYKFPKKLLLGISDIDYIKYGKEIYEGYGIPYKYSTPHNLFLSHLKLYGIFSIVEVIYTSYILKKVVDESNILLFYGILFYSILLGAGLYSYWLYLSIFALILMKGNDKNEYLYN